jgi:hypothetical protein
VINQLRHLFKTVEYPLQDGRTHFPGAKNLLPAMPEVFLSFEKPTASGAAASLAREKLPTTSAVAFSIPE